MSKILDKEVVVQIREFLQDKENMPHIVCCWCLAKRGIKLSGSALRKIRLRYNIPYTFDARVTNSITYANSRNLPITHEFLKERCPDICEEYRDYLVEKYYTKPKATLPPFKVSGIAGVVTQILHA